MNIKEMQKLLAENGFDYGEDAVSNALVGYELASPDKPFNVKVLSPFIVFEWLVSLDNIGIDHATDMLLEIKKENWQTYVGVRYVMQTILSGSE